MPSLEDFLNKNIKKQHHNVEEINGSFSCQNKDCDETVYDGFVDKDESRIYWTCSQGHESSVVI